MRDLQIGFTGTRKGMTPQQKWAIRNILSQMQESYNPHVHHGDCIGADSDMHHLCLELHIPMTHYPCDLSTQRAYLQGAVRVMPVKKPLQRNKDIVDQSDFVLATPGEDIEVLRSGTWSTIRYAKKTNKPLLVIYPDGTTDR